MNECRCRQRNSNFVAHKDENLNFIFDKNENGCRFFLINRVRGWRRQKSLPSRLVAMPFYNTYFKRLFYWLKFT